MLTSAHWELTWCLEGTLASFASPDKPSDNKRDGGYHRRHCQPTLSRVPLLRVDLRTDKPSKNEFEPGTFHRFARKRVAEYCQLTLQCQRIDNRMLLLKVPKTRYCIFNMHQRVHKIPMSESKRNLSYVTKWMNVPIWKYMELSNETWFSAKYVALCASLSILFGCLHSTTN